MKNSPHVIRFAAGALVLVLTGTAPDLRAADPVPPPCQGGPGTPGGYGMGPGVMGGYGMGPGMMGGYGGYGMGPGMMGGYGIGPGMMGGGMMGSCCGSGLNLTPEQQTRMN